MRYQIVNSRTGEIVAEDALLAEQPLVRMKGLLGRASLPPGEAIILRPASSIHMMFMRFAIDVIYLDRNDMIVKLVPNLKPWRFSAARGAHTVIEMASDETHGIDLQPGDRLVMNRLSESLSKPR